jgi:hypothetical protein
MPNITLRDLLIHECEEETRRIRFAPIKRHLDSMARRRKRRAAVKPYWHWFGTSRILVNPNGTVRGRCVKFAGYYDG